jgi:hypothetical protein
VLRLIYVFVDIALHRRGPDQLPSALFFFNLVLAVAVVVELAVLVVADAVRRPVVLALFDTVLDLAFLWAVLKSFGRERRFRQTAAAMLGTDTLLNVLSIPVALWNRSLGAPTDQLTMPALLFLLLFIWSIDISAFVLARAVERPYVLGVAVMLGYVMLTLSLRATLFPAAA